MTTEQEYHFTKREEYGVPKNPIDECRFQGSMAETSDDADYSYQDVFMEWENGYETLIVGDEEMPPNMRYDDFVIKMQKILKESEDGKIYFSIVSTNTYLRKGISLRTDELSGITYAVSDK